jgi:hypothetical protein
VQCPPWTCPGHDIHEEASARYIGSIGFHAAAPFSLLNDCRARSENAYKQANPLSRPRRVACAGGGRPFVGPLRRAGAGQREPELIPRQPGQHHAPR